MANETGHALGRAFQGQDGKINSFGSAGQVLAANGAITITEGSVAITKVTACAITLAAPVVGEDDFKRLLIMSTTAAAHTVTQTTPGFSGGTTTSDVGTFGAAIGNYLEVMAYNGVWYPVGNLNVTIA